MATYAIVRDAKVENVVIAEEVDILGLFFPGADEIIEVTTETGDAFMGGSVIAGRFQPLTPFPSWLWDAESWSWIAPVPYPDGGNGYTWDEDAQAWIEMPAPEPAPPAE